MSRFRRWSPWLLVAAVVGSTAVYFSLATATQSIVYDVVAVVSGVVMLLAAHRNRPEPVAAWVLLGFGVLALAGGDIVFGSSQPVPSAADMLYISAHPLLGLGFIGLAPPRWTKGGRGALPAGLAVAAFAGVVSWTFLILPGGDRAETNVVRGLVAIGYPVMDVVLIALLARAALPARFGEPAHRFLLAALILKLGADVAYAADSLGMSYKLGGGVDALWLVSYAFFGAALLQPAARSYVLWEMEAAEGAIRHRQVAESEREPDRQPVRAATRRAPRMRLAAAQGTQFAAIVSASGRALLALAIVAMLLGAAWLSVQVVLLAGAYGTTGVLMIVAGAVASP